MRLYSALCALLLTLSSGLFAQQRDSLSLRDRVMEEADRIVNPDESFGWNKLILPAALISFGAWGVENNWYYINVNRPLKDWAEELRDDLYIHVDDYIQLLPSAAYLGLGFLTEAEHSLRERLAVFATSSLLMGVTVNLLKYTVRSMRPDESRRNSFPSGHTATAMMGAELIRLEYGGWYGVGAYAVDLSVAALRLYNNRHWSNDVIGGTAIGILSANAAYWLLPWERKVLGWDDLSVRPAVLPVGEGTPGYGMALAVHF